MRYLLPSCESKKRVELLLKLTGIRSEAVKKALMVYLVDGIPAPRSAARHGLALQNFHRAVERLNKTAEVVEQIKALDFKKYHQLSDDKK